MQIFNLVLVTILMTVAYQDFKCRAISWWLIPLLGLLFFFNGLFYVSIGKLIKYFLLNVGFLAFQMIILTGYFSIKKRKFVNILNEYIGLGDILFFLVLGLFFSPYQFIFFHVIGLFLVLMVYGTIILLKKDSSKYIPLAGALALILVLLIISKIMIKDFNFYNQQYFKEFLISLYGLS